MSTKTRTQTRRTVKKNREIDENVDLLAKKRKPVDDPKPRKKFAESSYLEKRAVAAVYYDMLTRRPMIFITNKEQILAIDALRSKMKDQKKAGNLTDDSDSSTKLIEMSNMKSSSLSECLLEPTAFEVQEKEVNTSFESNESDDGDSLDMVESKNSDQICKGKEDNMLDPKDNNWSGEDTAMSYFLTSDVDSSAQNDDSSIYIDHVTNNKTDVNKSKESLGEPDKTNKVQHNRSSEFDDSEEDYKSSSCSDSETSFEEDPKSFKVTAIVHSPPEPYPSAYNDSVERVAEIITISSDSEVSEIDCSLSPVKSDYTDKNAEVWNRDDADIIQEEPRRGTGLFDNPDPENFSHLQLSLSDLDEASFIEINKMSTYQEVKREEVKGLNGKAFLANKKINTDEEVKRCDSLIELSDESSLDLTKEEDSSKNVSYVEENDEEEKKVAESSDDKIFPPKALLIDDEDDEPSMTDLLILAAFGILISTLRNYLQDLPLF